MDEKILNKIGILIADLGSVNALLAVGRTAAVELENRLKGREIDRPIACGLWVLLGDIHKNIQDVINNLKELS